jgi:hypothetical protein
VIEVAHEALFRVWPRLAGWLDEARDFLIGKARLDQMFQDWQKLETAERRKGLLSGIMLDRARGWLAAYPHRFSDAERAFIEESDRAEVEDQQKLLREAQRATDALAAATETADALIFNLAQKFRRSGLPNAMVREILEEARRLLDRLNTGDNRSIALERRRMRQGSSMRKAWKYSSVWPSGSRRTRKPSAISASAWRRSPISGNGKTRRQRWRSMNRAWRSDDDWPSGSRRKRKPSAISASA